MSIERAIYISSINREKSGVSRTDDFVTRFVPSLVLPEGFIHEIGVSPTNLTYSWHNVREQYGNNVISNDGISFHTITFPSGMYSYDDINLYLHEYMKRNGHFTNTSGVDKFDINIIFVLTTYKVVIEISNNYQLDLRNSNFGDLLSFDKKIISQNEYSSRLQNITNDIDVLHINTNIVDASLLDGVTSDTISVIPTANLRISIHS